MRTPHGPTNPDLVRESGRTRLWVPRWLTIRRVHGERPPIASLPASSKARIGEVSAAKQPAHLQIDKARRTQLGEYGIIPLGMNFRSGPGVTRAQFAISPPRRELLIPESRPCSDAALVEAPQPGVTGRGIHDIDLPAGWAAVDVAVPVAAHDPVLGPVLAHDVDVRVG